MTDFLFSDFKERAKEVRKYLIFLKGLESESINIKLGISPKEKTKKVDEDLIKTLKASAFLLLYNLVEATMRNAMQAIFDEIKNQKISFDQIKPEIKKTIIKSIKNHNPQTLLDKISSISIDIISATFDENNLFSGNIDAREVKEIANIYGFSVNTDARKTNNGADLLTIKSHRNNLAHGFSSFNQVGKDVSVEELLQIEKKIVKYLSSILSNIEIYLDNKEYLDN
ncbi:MAG: hypothetical protein GVY04_19945 [Cyanobacteria bacterium]|jgi:hypothetical protein|nr:hypothetical protein [Cyanobacteria bacterium GSL.Bin1]